MVEVIEILKQVVGYTPQDRKGFLVMALQGTNALERVDLQGSLAIFTPNLVETMLSYGEVEKGKHALWALLETAREQIGIDYTNRIDVLRLHIEQLSSCPITPAE